MQIGPCEIDSPLVLAPMAGVTDKPFRLLCRRLGAGYAVSEMLAADPRLWNTRKSTLRRDHTGEPEPVGVQIAGTVPGTLALAARHNVDAGAAIIDINMGCPAKKVCRSWAGSALLQDEALVARILSAVVAAVEVPVTLKIRTGWDRDHVNGLRIARIAVESGIAALTVHGRTRDMHYTGEAEYDTIAEIVDAIGIPVIANGDVDSPTKARAVLDHTQAAALMIGRSAMGRPWIFREIAHFLAKGERLPEPSPLEIKAIMLEHISRLHEFYGAFAGVRIARKHLGWYVKGRRDNERFRQIIFRAETPGTQLRLAGEFFDALSADEPVCLAA
jgi:tRNA-dihydrouridine synthase B